MSETSIDANKRKRLYNPAILAGGLMVCGGAVAQGFGGLLFGLGLWLIIALIYDEITKIIEK